MMVQQPQRTYVDRLGLDASTLTEYTPEELKKGEVSLWQEKHKSEETSLVLKSKDEIEKYVLSVVRNYFRTTKKAKVALDTPFEEHGLDSLDVIELVIQVEDELGYVIDAENLGKFKKPKHFVNFITHMEAYKSEFHKLPYQGVNQEFSFAAAFPGIPGLDKKQPKEVKDGKSDKKAEHH